MNIATTIQAWYHKNKRTLPWRKEKDPYKIWLSEIILQQTRVEQGMQYYYRFIEQFPDIHTLAKANEQTVLKLWQGLGYYNRARNLHTTARYIVNELNGKFPQSYKELIKLKGVGAYTAAAIASFAYNEQIPAIDGNVARVIARLFGVNRPVNTTSGAKELQTIAGQLIPPANSGMFNQAMIEFGAIQCTPRNPQCESCPLKEVCYAYKNGQVDKLPVKNKQIKQRNRYFNYLKIHSGNSLFLQKRTGNDIWRNLYEFPLIETRKQINPEAVLQLQEWQQILKNLSLELLYVSPLIKHQLSHQRIYGRIFAIRLTSTPAPESYLRQQYLEIRANRFEQYPVPRLITRLLEDHKQTGLPL